MAPIFKLLMDLAVVWGVTSVASKALGDPLRDLLSGRKGLEELAREVERRKSAAQKAAGLQLGREETTSEAVQRRLAPASSRVAGQAAALQEFPVSILESADILNPDMIGAEALPTSMAPLRKLQVSAMPSVSASEIASAAMGLSTLLPDEDAGLVRSVIESGS